MRLTGRNRSHRPTPAVRRPGASVARRADDGFAVIDALMALMILSITISLTLAAGITSRRVAAAAEEAREAETALAMLLAGSQGRGAIGVSSGQLGRFDWRREVAVSTLPDANAETRLCRISVSLRASGQRRIYRAATLRSCRVELTP